MLEVAGGFAIEAGDSLHAQLFQQLRQDDAANGVHSVESHTELAGLDSLYVHECEVLHEVDVLLVVAVILAVLAQMIDISILEVLGSGDA